jgi:hypothetical protein
MMGYAGGEEGTGEHLRGLTPHGPLQSVRRGQGVEGGVKGGHVAAGMLESVARRRVERCW